MKGFLRGLAHGAAFVAGAAVAGSVLGLPSALEVLDEWAARKVRRLLDRHDDSVPVCVAGVRGCTEHVNYQLRDEARRDHARRRGDLPGPHDQGL